MTDFGIAKIARRGKRFTVRSGTPAYLAPEVLRKQSYDPYAADMWALGVCLYYMLVGGHPFRGVTKKEITSEIINCRYELP